MSNDESIRRWWHTMGAPLYPALGNQPELAGQAARQPRGDRQPHRRDDDPHRSAGPERTRLEHLAGRTVPDADMATLYLRPDDFHGEWNYTLLTRLMLLQE
jgi:hypothetical protein